MPDVDLLPLIVHTWAHTGKMHAHRIKLERINEIMSNILYEHN